MGDDGALNLDTENLANVAKGATHVFDPIKDGMLPGLAVIAFVALILFSALWVKKRQGNLPPEDALISNWPSGLRAALWPLLAAFALTHAFSAGSVYYNTSIANPTTQAYFESLGIGRLSSLSHAHLFAHATMYFLLAVLVQFAGGGLLVTAYAPLAALWAGVFDVVSWWGLKKISANFEILSAACGMLFSVGFLIMAFAILRASFGFKARR